MAQETVDPIKVLAQEIRGQRQPADPIKALAQNIRGQASNPGVDPIKELAAQLRGGVAVEEAPQPIYPDAAAAPVRPDWRVQGPRFHGQGEFSPTAQKVISTIAEAGLQLPPGRLKAAGEVSGMAREGWVDRSISAARSLYGAPTLTEWNTMSARVPAVKALVSALKTDNDRARKDSLDQADIDENFSVLAQSKLREELKSRGISESQWEAAWAARAASEAEPMQMSRRPREVELANEVLAAANSKARAAARLGIERAPLTDDELRDELWGAYTSLSGQDQAKWQADHPYLTTVLQAAGSLPVFMGAMKLVPTHGALGIGVRTAIQAGGAETALQAAQVASGAREEMAPGEIAFNAATMGGLAKGAEKVLQPLLKGAAGAAAAELPAGRAAQLLKGAAATTPAEIRALGTLKKAMGVANTLSTTGQLGGLEAAHWLKEMATDVDGEGAQDPVSLRLWRVAVNSLFGAAAHRMSPKAVRNADMGRIVAQVERHLASEAARRAAGEAIKEAISTEIPFDLLDRLTAPPDRSEIPLEVLDRVTRPKTQADTSTLPDPILERLTRPPAPSPEPGLGMSQERLAELPYQLERLGPLPKTRAERRAWLQAGMQADPLPTASGSLSGGLVGQSQVASGPPSPLAAPAGVPQSVPQAPGVAPTSAPQRAPQAAPPQVVPRPVAITPTSQTRKSRPISKRERVFNAIVEGDQWAVVDESGGMRKLDQKSADDLALEIGTGGAQVKKYRMPLELATERGVEDYLEITLRDGRKLRVFPGGGQNWAAVRESFGSSERGAFLFPFWGRGRPGLTEAEREARARGAHLAGEEVAAATGERFRRPLVGMLAARYRAANLSPEAAQARAEAQAARHFTFSGATREVDRAGDPARLAKVQARLSALGRKKNRFAQTQGGEAILKGNFDETQFPGTISPERANFTPAEWAEGRRLVEEFGRESRAERTWMWESGYLPEVTIQPPPRVIEGRPPQPQAPLRIYKQDFDRGALPDGTPVNRNALPEGEVNGGFKFMEAEEARTGIPYLHRTYEWREAERNAFGGRGARGASRALNWAGRRAAQSVLQHRQARTFEEFKAMGGRSELGPTVDALQLEARSAWEGDRLNYFEQHGGLRRADDIPGEGGAEIVAARKRLDEIGNERLALGRQYGHAHRAALKAQNAGNAEVAATESLRSADLLEQIRGLRDEASALRQVAAGKGGWIKLDGPGWGRHVGKFLRRDLHDQIGSDYDSQGIIATLYDAVTSHAKRMRTGASPNTRLLTDWFSNLVEVDDLGARPFTPDGIRANARAWKELWEFVIRGEEPEAKKGQTPEETAANREQLELFKEFVAEHDISPMVGASQGEPGKLPHAARELQIALRKLSELEAQGETSLAWGLVASVAAWEGLGASIPGMKQLYRGANRIYSLSDMAVALAAYRQLRTGKGSSYGHPMPKAEALEIIRSYFSRKSNLPLVKNRAFTRVFSWSGFQGKVGQAIIKAATRPTLVGKALGLREVIASDPGSKKAMAALVVNWTAGRMGHLAKYGLYGMALAQGMRGLHGISWDDWKEQAEERLKRFPAPIRQYLMAFQIPVGARDTSILDPNARRLRRGKQIDFVDASDLMPWTAPMKYLTGFGNDAPFGGGQWSGDFVRGMIGKNVLAGPLYQAGMGEDYRGEATTVGRRVWTAVKMLTPGMLSKPIDEITRLMDDPLGQIQAGDYVASALESITGINVGRGTEEAAVALAVQKLIQDEILVYDQTPSGAKLVRIKPGFYDNLNVEDRESMQLAAHAELVSRLHNNPSTLRQWQRKWAKLEERIDDIKTR